MAHSIPHRGLKNVNQSYIAISRYFHPSIVTRGQLRTKTNLCPNRLCGFTKRSPRPQCRTANPDESYGLARSLNHGQSYRYLATDTDQSNRTFSSFDWTRLENYTCSEDVEEGSIHLHGYITSHRPGRKVDFFTLVDPHLRSGVQVVCPKQAIKLHDDTDQAHSMTLRPHTPLLVRGKITKAQKLPAGWSEGTKTATTVDQYVGSITRIGHVEIQAEEILPLNSFPEHVVAKHDTNFPPEQRHLTFRTNHGLRDAIKLRSRLKHKCSEFLLRHGFDDVETPILFKSTPEGAREFVVPTRKKGFAYALPQSPQQYKQILMACGIPRYFQFARCFRDEDMRADRQPEFSQLDLEMSFADGRTVMSVVENLILQVAWPEAGLQNRLDPDILQRIRSQNDGGTQQDIMLPVLTYEDVMKRYGSDKPDPRLGAEIKRIDDAVSEQLKKMLTDIENPIVEMIKIPTKHFDPAKSREFMNSFMSLPSSIGYVKNPQGMAGISIYDPSKPLSGLATFGYEAAAVIEERFEPDDGDLLIAFCRPDHRLVGGSTILGNLRRDLLAHAITQGLIDEPITDSMFWVTDFPLFSPEELDAPGQGGAAGMCSTHHPFTAPRSEQDLSLLRTDPHKIIGDHYDLVINGTEVGGGSRRIHDPKMQELIFRDVLKMRSERIEDFRHLLDALEAGCPPHAGFALGFDRLLTLLLGRTSVRDVIAFPKWGDGEDKFVGSPSELTAYQLSTYHLKVSDEFKSPPEAQVSIKG